MFTPIPSGPFNWNDHQKTAEPYSKSPAVRDWLVHTALASNNVPLTSALRASHAASFKRVCEGVRNGQIVLDYQPSNENVVEIPPINHPHYMQAMLYWCVRLDCNLAPMSEAYAQLGRGTRFEQLAATVKRVIEEETQAVKGWLRTKGRSVSPAATIPMFRG